MKIIKHCDTGERLAGTASAELVRQSEALGAVSAYVDGMGVWYYVGPGEGARDPRFCGREIVTVVVEDTSKGRRPEERSAAEPIGRTGALGMPPRVVR
jgi:hypothetical protein